MVPKQYKRRVALFLAWAHDPRISTRKDPLWIGREMDGLRRVLVQGYGFEVITYRMELHHPQGLVTSKVENFIQGYSDPENLLLVYYGGHGMYVRKQGMFWVPSSHRIPQVSDYDSMLPARPLLEHLVKASSDVIIVICCCSAAPKKNKRMAINYESGGGTTEILGACRIGQNTSAEYSPQIVSLLKKRFSQEKSTSVRAINTDISKGLLRILEGLCSPDRRLPPHGKNPKPVHLQLHGESDEDTIVLTPVQVQYPIVLVPLYAESSWFSRLRKMFGKKSMKSWDVDVGDGSGVIR